MSDTKAILHSKKNFNTSPDVEIYAFPASYGQKQLYFLHQMDAKSPVYNIPFAFKLKGSLNIDILEKSLNEIINRHETFRTTFTFKNGFLKQVISSHLRLELDLFDFSSDQNKEIIAKQKVVEYTLKPFDLENGPLIRFGLILLNPVENILLLSFHHTILDHTAVLVFFKELSTIYNSFIDAKEPDLPIPTIQYADTVIWQQDEKQNSLFHPKLEYWKEQLKNQKSYLEFPTDKQRPVRQTFNGIEIQKTLSKDLSDKIKEFSRKEKKSLFMVLLAAYKILLYRYTGQNDITVGCPFANRTQPGLEDVMGCCMNTLPLRTKFSEEDSFLNCLDKVRDVVLDAQSNQEISFEQIVEEIHPVRDVRYNPLFQVSFMFQEPLTSFPLKDVECKSIPIQSYTSRFDFTFWTWDTSEGFQTLIQYNSDLFEEETIERIFKNFSKLLEEIIKNPGKKICEFEILDDKEKNYLLYELNKTQKDFPREFCINQLFEDAVKKFPQNIAVSFGKEKVTYKELNQRANKLANYLIELGVGSEYLVGILLDRSIDMVVTILGILKAGAAYVPLDPSFPLDRLEFMLNDAKIRTIITHKNLFGLFKDFAGTEICIDTNTHEIDKMKDTNPEKSCNYDNLAYVIYTSGSTGRPKGVQIEHRSFVNFILSMQKRPGLDENDTFLSVTTLSFDIAGLEIFLPLITGARLLIVSKESTLNGKYLIELIDSEEITVMQATPATYRLMLLAGWKERKKIKLLCGGEPLPVDLAKELIPNSAELWNMYGPTETTVWSTIKKVTDPENITIGRPIDNTFIYILDKNLNPVPINVTGELFIGGDGVARGYLNRPELNYNSFIQNPFNPTPEARIYKTGDLARFKSNGEIECLGRVDQQVKVRGYRIEPGEIETILSEHENVDQVVVVARNDHEGSGRLIAYLTVNQGKIQANENLKQEHLAEWQLIWNDAYANFDYVGDPTFNISGWKSSYNGKPMPEEQMKEWVNNTVDSILEYNPENILEIGCGTGLLLFRLAPNCRNYTGIDFSQSVLNLTEKVVKEKKLKNVSLYCQKADDLSNLKTASYDMIVINSVVQYFPSIDYLFRIIENAISLLKPGGRIFIGDIRNRYLLDYFAFSVEIQHVDKKLKCSELFELVNKRISEEEELVIDPQFFYQLNNKYQKISNIEVKLKRGKYLNELTKYRYDVILHVNGKYEETIFEKFIDIQEKSLTPSGIESIIKDSGEQSIAIKNVPNSRIYYESKLFHLLEETSDDVTIADGLEVMKSNKENGIDPEMIYEIGKKYNRKTIITWSHSGFKDCFDAFILNSKSDHPISFKLPSLKENDLKAYANNPLISQFSRILIPELKELLKSKLPEYMVPSIFMIIEEFPLTPNGKIDRKALPAPEISRVSLSEKYTPPRNEIEKQLTKIWEKILRVQNISTHDNFFDLGGHSILVIHLFKQIENELNVELSIATIFEHPTINQLASKIMDTLIKKNN